MNIQFYFVLRYFQHSHKNNVVPTMNSQEVEGQEMLCEYTFSFVTDSWARNVSCSFEFHVITLAEPFQYGFPLLYLQFIQLVSFLEQCCQYSECSSSTTYCSCVFLTVLLTHRWREHHTGWTAIDQWGAGFSPQSLGFYPRQLCVSSWRTGASFSECPWFYHTVH